MASRYIALLLLRCSARKGEVEFVAGPTAAQRRAAAAADEAADANQGHGRGLCCGEGSRAGRLASLLYWDVSDGGGGRVVAMSVRG